MRYIWFFMTVLMWLNYDSALASDEDSNNVLDKRFIFYGGVLFHDARGEFSSTKEGRPVVKIDLDDLDLKANSKSIALGAIVNFGNRWNLRLDYYGYHDDATNTAEFDFNFDDVIIPVGARIDSSLDLDVYAVSLSYDIIHRERARFGVGVGAHVADFALEISAESRVGDKEVFLGEGRQDITAPLPNLYVSGAYGITDRFIFRLGGGWMSLNYKDYSGNLLFGGALLEYWPFRYAGFGIGYRYLFADINYEPGDKEASAEIRLPGPILYLTVGF